MSFTDKDLEELKELTQATLYWSPKIPDLIYHLKCAEAIVHRNSVEHNPLRHDYEKEEAHCESCQEYKAWFKSKETE